MYLEFCYGAHCVSLSLQLADSRVPLPSIESLMVSQQLSRLQTCQSFHFSLHINVLTLMKNILSYRLNILLSLAKTFSLINSSLHKCLIKYSLKSLFYVACRINNGDVLITSICWVVKVGKIYKLEFRPTIFMKFKVFWSFMT